jgi:hypothetical protein
MRWVQHLKYMGGDELITKFWSKNAKGRDHLGDLGVGMRIILE